MTILSLVLEPMLVNKYRIQTYKKNVDDNTESSTGTNVGKQI